MKKFLEVDPPLEQEDGGGAQHMVAAQEHGLASPEWAAECAASMAARGWRLIIAPSVTTQTGGRSAGVLGAIPTRVSAKMADGQNCWDISPRGGEGRLSLVVVEMHGVGRLALFCVYRWTIQGLGAPNRVADRQGLRDAAQGDVQTVKAFLGPLKQTHAGAPDASGSSRRAGRRS